MSIFETPDFKLAAREAERLVKDLPKLIGAEAEAFFKGSFENQGFTDRYLKPWRSTKSGKQNIFGRRSQGILIGTGTLKRAIRYAASIGMVQIVIDGNVVPYAEIHNAGGVITVPVTEKARKFFWYMYYETEKDEVEEEDMVWKKMALTSKTHLTIKIPKRQFMGESHMLNEQIDHIIQKEFDAIERKLLKR